MTKIAKQFRYYIAIVLIPFFISCADAGINLSPVDTTAGKKGGIYHGIWGKENIWLIAEAYNKTVKELAIANKLRTPFDLGVGDKIFIPGVKKRQTIEFKDPAWNVSLKSISWPLDGEIVCDWDCDDGKKGLSGITMTAPEGSSIKAVRDGWVVYEGNDFTPYGNMIILQHGYVLASIYACTSKNLVKVGDRMDEGEPIAVIGKCEGYNLPTLHFEVVHYNKRINPHNAFETTYEELQIKRVIRKVLNDGIRNRNNTH